MDIYENNLLNLVKFLHNWKGWSEYISNTFNQIEDRFYCCRGYCIDLLKELAKRNNFTYSLALSPDGQFGHFAHLFNVTGKFRRFQSARVRFCACCRLLSRKWKLAIIFLQWVSWFCLSVSQSNDKRNVNQNIQNTRSWNRVKFVISIQSWGNKWSYHQKSIWT